MAKVLDKIKKTEKEIEKLKNRISLLQKKCRHSWKKNQKPDLKESLVPGTYIGECHGYISETLSVPKTFDFGYECTKCNKTVSWVCTLTCPNCLTKLDVLHPCLGAGSRVQYFGERYLYYSIQLRGCQKCKFLIACDEWDQ